MVEGGSEVEQDERLYKMRHSLAHILAQAMQRYRPGTLLGFGPATEDGFYYDFILPQPIEQSDLKPIESLMREIIKEGQPFEREDLSAAAAVTRLEEMKEPHKVEYAKELIEKRSLESLSFYTNGPFVDMCEGPHLDTTKQIPIKAFKLHAISGAYWRGDEGNASMTRVRGWCFADPKELKAYQKAREEAEKRDHRKLGAELDLFTIDDDVGRGLPMWLPAGAVLVEELEKLAKEWEFLDGYQRVRTPVITKGKLYEISGHMQLYKDAMYPPMQLKEDEGDETTEAYYLRPMNCPHHHKVFAARPRSYRDLPLRLAEYGHTFRYERSGTLQGLTRVRGMCMNDAHIYITEDQITDEFIRVMDLHRRYYELFGLSNYFFRLSLWDPDDPKGKQKYVNDPEAWAKSEDRVRSAMKQAGLPFHEVKGEAAFYGPKIDVQFKTVGLKEFTVSTNQLDFAVPKRFLEAGIDMTFTDSDGQKKLPYVIHRAPLSTHERFVSFLIEHYGADFPLWLAPEQVRVLPITDKVIDYAEEVARRLHQQMIRVEVDRTSDKLGKKVAKARNRRVTVMLVVGEKERDEETVNVRRRGIEAQRSMKLAEVEALLAAEIRQRKHVQSWDDVEALR